ncbi:hypothetical protein RHMOL_Rhmol09G0072500 [Rhododendron molle]|uniref:Uncharacterized protein n=1 Tax=Rhododendron molle TaxID=49168 RepID=A0ACC0MAZ1_RHOML|nr:hypothetical protein RHMOL_Rhmol09G0072500 [Rhododendron molle]
MDEMNFDESKDLVNNLRLHTKKWDIDDKVNRMVHKTYFAGLLKSEARVTHNMPLLSAIVDCYNEDTRSFTFNEHNFVYKDSSEVCFNWLKKHFEKVPEGVEENSPQILPFVRAFLMYILGSVVFPTKSGNKVSVRYLPLLKNMDEMDKYAWSASQLVHLHKSLSNCKKKTTTSIAGHTCSLLVKICFIFAMEHIPKLALHLTGATLEEHIANLPKSFPLLVGWAKLLEKSANNAWKAKDKAEFKKTLNRIYEGMEGDDEMDEEDGCKIVWQPYKRLGPLDQFLPPYCIGQQKMGMSRTVFICFKRFAYHRPDISPKQFGVSSGVKFQPSSSCNSEPVSPIVHNQVGIKLVLQGDEAKEMES